MSEKKRKRYPADRHRLHDLLEKKEESLLSLEAEVKELRSLVRQADFTAINATAEMYNVTPEQFAQIMQSLRDRQEQAFPELPPDAIAVPILPDEPEKEDMSGDHDET